MGDLNQAWRRGEEQSVSAKVTHHENVTPNDSAEVRYDGLRFSSTGVAGDVSLTLETGDTIIYAMALTDVLQGYGITKVNATGTTATGLVGLRY